MEHPARPGCGSPAPRRSSPPSRPSLQATDLVPVATDFPLNFHGVKFPLTIVTPDVRDSGPEAKIVQLIQATTQGSYWPVFAPFFTRRK